MEAESDKQAGVGSEYRQDPLVGTLFDNRYQILKLLGRGGTSSVYEARHREMDRIVALKILHSYLQSDPETVQRFQREARAVSSLDHVNIVKVYGFGVTEEGQPFMSSEFLLGESLSEKIRSQGRLPADTALAIFCQIVAALSHAHSQGVIHRDLKPGNVMIVRGRGGGGGAAEDETVKVVDFGLARLPGGTEKIQQKLTQTGKAFGSPAYMSPEQCLGQAVDARSDIYSLGCLMFEALTGSLPFSGANELDLMSRHCQQPVPPLGTKASGLTLPPSLEAAVYRCLEKQAGNRFPSMEAVGLALAAASDEAQSPARVEPVPAGTPEPGLLARRRPSRLSPLLLPVLLAVCVACLSGKIFLEWQLDCSDKEAERLYGQGNFEGAVLPAQKVLLLRRLQFWVRDDKSLYLHNVFLARLYLKQKKPAAAVPFLLESVNIARGGGADLKRDLVLSQSLLADAYYGDGKLAEAKEAYEAAICLSGQLFGRDSLNELRLQVAYAKLLLEIDPRLAVSQLKDVCDHLLSLAFRLVTLGDALSSTADQNGAREKYRQALEYCLLAVDGAGSLGQSDVFGQAQVWQATGQCYMRMGEHQKGIDSYARAREAVRKACGDRDPRLWEATTALATALCEDKQFAEAGCLLEKELAKVSQVKGAESLEALLPLDALVWACWGQGKLARQEELQIQGLKIACLHLEPTDPRYRQQIDSFLRFFHGINKDVRAKQILSELLKEKALRQE